MLITTSLPWAPSTWKVWVDHIMKHRNSLGVKRAALIRHNGVMASASCGYVVPQRDIMKFESYFEAGDNLEKISVRGKTFVVKQTNPSQIVAFNGSRYIILSKSNTMYLLVKVTPRSRKTSDDAARFVSKMNDKLLERNF